MIIVWAECNGVIVWAECNGVKTNPRLLTILYRVFLENEWLDSNQTLNLESIGTLDL